MSCNVTTSEVTTYGGIKICILLLLLLLLLLLGHVPLEPAYVHQLAIFSFPVFLPDFVNMHVVPFLAQNPGDATVCTR